MTPHGDPGPKPEGAIVYRQNTTVLWIEAELMPYDGWLWVVECWIGVKAKTTTRESRVTFPDKRSAWAYYMERVRMFVHEER